MKSLGSPPYVCLITRGEANPSNFETEKKKILKTARDAVADGVNLFQIREKALTARLLFDLTLSVVEALASSDAIVIVNDRADVAVAAMADGVHLPESGLLPRIVRDKFPRDLVIGVSTHSYSAAKSSAYAKADYVFYGPVFQSPGKGEPVGVPALEDVCREHEGFPVIALGGIDKKNFDRTLAAGAAGIAAIRSLNDPESRRQICAAISAL